MRRSVVVLSAALGLALVISMLVGPTPSGTAELRDFVLYSVRAPRVLVCALVGGALGLAGAVSQGFFRNDLADPSIIGVNLSAALGAVTAFVLGLDNSLACSVSLFAMLGAALHLGVLMWLRRRVSGSAGLLLAGIAVGALSSAAISVLHQLSIGDFALQRRILSWLFGSFEGLVWGHAAIGGAALAAALPILIRLRAPLDDLLLGGSMAERYGHSASTLSALALSAIALLVGVSSALVGAVGFVGLVVPHIGRLLTGPKHGTLLWFSGLGGALLLVTVDAVLRSLPIYFAPGVLMSLLGAPFFLWLLLRGRRHA